MRRTRREVTTRDVPDYTRHLKIYAACSKVVLCIIISRKQPHIFDIFPNPDQCAILEHTAVCALEAGWLGAGPRSRHQVKPLTAASLSLHANRRSHFYCFSESKISCFRTKKKCWIFTFLPSCSSTWITFCTGFDIKVSRVNWKYFQSIIYNKKFDELE